MHLTPVYAFGRGVKSYTRSQIVHLLYYDITKRFETARTWLFDFAAIKQKEIELH